MSLMNTLGLFDQPMMRFIHSPLALNVAKSTLLYISFKGTMEAGCGAQALYTGQPRRRSCVMPQVLERDNSKLKDCRSIPQFSVPRV